MSKIVYEAYKVDWSCTECFESLEPDTVDVNDKGNDVLDTAEIVTCWDCGTKYTIDEKAHKLNRIT